MPLNTTQADKELFDNYRNWSMGEVRVSNSPRGASQISRKTANALKKKWAPNAPSNAWNQSLRDAFVTKDNVSRWVTLSVSGGGSVVDFHAKWRSVTFLWHFEIV